MAVLQQSETHVRYQIHNPAVFNEKNAVGHSPLHLCGDWAQGITILIEAGLPCDEPDNSGMLPLDYAILMPVGADAVTILLEAGSPMTCCGDDCLHASTLDLALESAARAEFRGLSQWPLSRSIACLIEHIKWRRERLAVLAETHVPCSVLDELLVLGTAVDDTRARRTWSALERAGVKIPPSLETRGVFVYHEVRSKNLALYLYDMGFKNIEEYNRQGMTPIMYLAWQSGRQANSLQLETECLDLADWYLLHGADILRLHAYNDISTLEIAASLGTIPTYIMKPHEQNNLLCRFTGEFFKRQFIDPVVLKGLEDGRVRLDQISLLSPLLLLFVQKAPPERQDSCNRGCPCCRPGSTLTANFLLGMKVWSHNSLKLYSISALLYNWYNVLAAKGVSMGQVLGEVRRFIAFEKLTLTHTCCLQRSHDEVEIRSLSADDVNEIRDEEEELLAHLEDMLQEPDSDWWNSPSKLDILLDVSSEGPPPTLKWAKLWLMQRAYGLNEEACEEIREASGLSEEQFWQSEWQFPELRPEFESWDLRKGCINGQQEIVARQISERLSDGTMWSSRIEFHLNRS